MKNLSKGFTLIELLVVIAILGVLAGALWVSLDPLDKMAQANDAKVQSDIGQIAQGMEAYAVGNSGYYATSLAQLQASGDLKNAPSAPANYMAYTVMNTNSANATVQTVYGQLKSKKYTAASYWGWCSSGGKAGTVSTTNACP